MSNDQERLGRPKSWRARRYTDRDWTLYLAVMLPFSIAIILVMNTHHMWWIRVLVGGALGAAAAIGGGVLLALLRSRHNPDLHL
jgi:hypothetical protein